MLRPTLCSKIQSYRLDRRTKMERFVRILTVILWVAATLFVAVLFAGGLSFDFLVVLLGSERLVLCQRWFDVLGRWLYPQERPFEGESQSEEVPSRTDPRRTPALAQ